MPNAWTQFTAVSQPKPRLGTIIRPAGRRCTLTGLLYLGRHPGNVEMRPESELIEQGLTPGLILALGDVSLRRQVIEHVQLVLDRAGRRRGRGAAGAAAGPYTGAATVCSRERCSRWCIMPDRA